MLTRNFRERISSEDALNHDWIKCHAPTAVAQLQDCLARDLHSFLTQNKLKQAALTIIAGEMDDDQIRGLRETFTSLDVDGDGLLSLTDVQEALDVAGVEMPPECVALLADMDD